MRRTEEYWYKFEYPRQPERKKESGLWTAVYEFVDSVKLAAVILMLVFALAARPVAIQGGSMQPTLYNGNWVLSVCNVHSLKQGDIVIIAPHGEVQKPLIKRIIAVGGDVIDIDFDSGEVSVNGFAVYEPYIKERTHLKYDVSFPLTVPEGYLFVMGDNRNESIDSRSSEVGLIDERNVMGVAKYSLLPFKSIS